MGMICYEKACPHLIDCLTSGLTAGVPCLRFCILAFNSTYLSDKPLAVAVCLQAQHVIPESSSLSLNSLFGAAKSLDSLDNLDTCCLLSNAI